MKLMTKSRFQNHAPSSPNAATRILSQCYDVIHFPGCVNREEEGEGNPIRLHDAEANGTWEQRWRDGQIDGSRQPECHSERRKTQRRRESEREGKREGTYARERTKRAEGGRQEGRMNARVGGPRGERKREGRTMYHHEVRRRGGRNAADAEQKRSALSAMLFAGITVSNLSLSSWSFLAAGISPLPLATPGTQFSTRLRPAFAGYRRAARVYRVLGNWRCAERDPYASAVIRD